MLQNIVHRIAINKAKHLLVFWYFGEWPLEMFIPGTIYFCSVYQQKNPLSNSFLRDSNLEMFLAILTLAWEITKTVAFNRSSCFRFYNLSRNMVIREREGHMGSTSIRGLMFKTSLSLIKVVIVKYFAIKYQFVFVFDVSTTINIDHVIILSNIFLLYFSQEPVSCWEGQKWQDRRDVGGAWRFGWLTPVIQRSSTALKYFTAYLEFLKILASVLYTIIAIITCRQLDYVLDWL